MRSRLIETCYHFATETLHFRNAGPEGRAFGKKENAVRFHPPANGIMGIDFNSQQRTGTIKFLPLHPLQDIDQGQLEILDCQLGGRIQQHNGTPVLNIFFYGFNPGSANTAPVFGGCGQWVIGPITPLYSIHNGLPGLVRENDHVLLG